MVRENEENLTVRLDTRAKAREECKILGTAKNALNVTSFLEEYPEEGTQGSARSAKM